MTKQNAKELALRMHQRGYLVTPPAIVDDVLAAHRKTRREKQKTSRVRNAEAGGRKKAAQIM